MLYTLSNYKLLCVVLSELCALYKILYKLVVLKYILKTIFNSSSLTTKYWMLNKNNIQTKIL